MSLVEKKICLEFFTSTQADNPQADSTLKQDDLLLGREPYVRAVVARWYDKDSEDGLNLFEAFLQSSIYCKPFEEQLL